MYIGRPQRTGPYITLDDISSQFNGVDVSFNLTSGGSPFIPDNPYTVSISLNGVIQEPVTSYTLVNDVITFANPPSSNSNFFALVIGLTSDRVITNATSLATGVDISAGDISGNNLSVSGNLTAAGIVSASSFVGDGSQLSGIDATSLIDQNGTVRAQANPAGLVVTGILTATQFDGVDVTALRDSAGGNIIVQANPGGVVINGIATATTFVGNVTGNVTGNTSGTAGGLTGTPNITVGSVTAASGSFSGNVSIGGTLTYEDVTNIDSVGLITARNGINVTGGGINVTGVTTTGAVSWGGHMLPTSNAAYDIGSADYKVRHLFLSDNSLKFVDSSDVEHPLSVDSGRLKFGGGLLLGNTIKADTTSGIVTATSFSATGGTDAIGIQSGGLNISTGIITALNFVGAGNTFSVNGSTVDISIAAGSDLVIVDGGDFNSSSSTAGASSEINGGEFT